MDRYIVIDLQEKSITTINHIDMKDTLDGDSILCMNNTDLLHESRKLLDDTEKMLSSNKYFVD